MTHGYEQIRVAANIPMLARMLLIQAERDRPCVWIGRATPRHWLGQGMRTGLRNAPSRYGIFSLEYYSEIAAAGKITATVEVPARTSGLELRVRVRAPLGFELERVRVDNAAWTDVDWKTNTVRLPRIAAGRHEITTFWRPAAGPG